MSTLYQHGTLANLVPGLFDGTATIAELLERGDTGIGTLEGLDGELIILNGVVYQVNARGEVRTVGDKETVPFANVHFTQFSEKKAVEAATRESLEAKMVQAIGTKNLFSAVLFTGTFEKMTTRAVAKQNKPYPGLGATADAQSVFEAENVEGTLIGYYSPALYAGVASPGWHLHFLSSGHDFGGHVLSYASAKGELSVQRFEDFLLHLPAENAEFLDTKLDNSVIETIKRAEG